MHNPYRGFNPIPNNPLIFPSSSLILLNIQAPSILDDSRLRMNEAGLNSEAVSMYPERRRAQQTPTRSPENLQDMAISIKTPMNQVQDNCGNPPEAQSHSVLSVNQLLPKKLILPLALKSTVQNQDAERGNEEQKEKPMANHENEPRPEQEKETEELKRNPVDEPNAQSKENPLRFPLQELAPEKPHRPRHSQKDRIEQKSRSVEAFRYRNVYKFILRNLNVYAYENAEKIKNALRNCNFVEEEIEKDLEFIKSLKPVGSPNNPNKQSRSKIKDLMNASLSLVFIFTTCVASILKKLRSGEFRLIHWKNLETYKESCAHHLEMAKTKLSERPDLLAHVA